jgi:hypothetical protein
MAGTVMEPSHTPLSTWFWAAYLIASQTPGMSAIQFQRQLGLSRYETAFGILHKLRAAMVRPERDKIGGKPQEHVEVDETWVGGRTRGEGRGVHHKVLVSCAVEVRHRRPGTKLDDRIDGRYAGRVRLAVVPDRSAKSLCGFVENAVAPGSLIVTDDWSGYAGLRKRGFDHHAIAEWGDPEVAEEFLPIIHLIFANLKTWINGVHHGVSQASTGLPQRIHLPIQSTLLPLQRVPLAARNRGRRGRANLRRALLRGMDAPHISGCG